MCLASELSGMSLAFCNAEDVVSLLLVKEQQAYPEMLELFDLW